MPQIDKQTSVGGPVKGKPGGVLSRIKPIKQTVGALRMSLYGRPKSGKTRLACTFPKPLLVIGSEDGTASVVGVKGADFVHLVRTDEIYEIAEGPLAAGKYVTVVMDNGTKLRDMRVQELWDSRGGVIPERKPFLFADKQWKEVWTQCSNDIRNLLRPLLDLARKGVNVVLIAQEQDYSGDGQTVSDLITPTIGPALGKAVCDWVNAECDYVGQTLIREQTRITEPIPGQKISVGTGKKEYCLRVAPHEVYQAGFRVPLGRTLLQEFIVDPDYAKIMKVIQG